MNTITQGHTDLIWQLDQSVLDMEEHNKEIAHSWLGKNAVFVIQGTRGNTLSVLMEWEDKPRLLDWSMNPDQNKLKSV